MIDMTPDEALAVLDNLRHDREAGEEAVKATPDAILAALEAGVTAAEIARRLAMSEGYVRKFRRKAGLQDKRYAHLKPPIATDAAPEPEVAPAVPSAVRADVFTLNAATITRLAAEVEETAPHAWVQTVTAGVPVKDRAYVLVSAALDEGYLSESRIPH